MFGFIHCTGPTQTIHDNLPLSKSLLVRSGRMFWPCKAIFIGTINLDIDIFGGPILLTIKKVIEEIIYSVEETVTVNAPHTQSTV